MAHVVVYLQRTPGGLHPASAVAACTARALATERGAAMLGICPGLSDAWDPAMERAAGRFGCDRLLFAGPSDVLELVRRLRPVHMLVPWTSEGLSVAQGLGLGDPVPRIVVGPPPGHAPLDAVTAVAAGGLPWLDLPAALDAEYTADAGMVPLPAWIEAPPPTPPPDFTPLSGPPFRAVVHGAATAPVEAALAALGAAVIPAAQVGPFEAGTLLWIEQAPAVLPASLDDRAASTTVVVLSQALGDHGRDDLRFADWVFRGDPAARLRSFAGPPWTSPSHERP